MAGAVGSSALVSPSFAFATEKPDPCIAALSVLENAARGVQNPRPWAMDYGRPAIDHLRKQVDDAMRALEAAEKRETDLEYAFIMDTISAIGGTAFAVLGVASLFGVTVFAPLTLAIAGVVWGGATYWGQMTFDENEHLNKDAGTVGDWLNAVGAPGSTISAFENQNDIIKAIQESKGIVNLLGEQRAAALNQTLSKYFMIGKGVSNFAKGAGALLGVLSAGFSIYDALYTSDLEDWAEESTNILREKLSKLQEELRGRVSLNQLAELHQAAAQALLDDFQSGKATCNGGLIMRNPSVLDTLEIPAGTGGSNSSAGGTGGLNGSNEGPQLRQAEPRNKRLKFTTGN